jgi:transposase
MVWLAVLTKKNSVVVSIDRKAAKCQNNISTDCEILRLPSSPSPQQNRIADVQLSTSRLWTYVRDDRPFAGPDPPAAVFLYSPDRGGEHPEQHLAGYAGLMQADAYAGFSKLYERNRKAGPIVEAACWAHGRRKFFDLARLTKAPIAAEAVKRIDVLFAIEREINGLAPQERLCVRQERSRPLIVELEVWLRDQRAKLSKNSDTTKAIN